MELIGDRNGESDASDGLIRVPIEYLLLFNRCRRGANSIRFWKFFFGFSEKISCTNFQNGLKPQEMAQITRSVIGAHFGFDNTGRPKG